MKISAAIRIQTPDLVVESVKASSGETFQTHLQRALCCRSCGRSGIPLYETNACKDCLAAEFRRLRPLFDAVDRRRP